MNLHCKTTANIFTSFESKSRNWNDLKHIWKFALTDASACVSFFRNKAPVNVLKIATGLRIETLQPPCVDVCVCERVLMRVSAHKPFIVCVISCQKRLRLAFSEAIYCTISWNSKVEHNPFSWDSKQFPAGNYVMWFYLLQDSEMSDMKWMIFITRIRIWLFFIFFF